MKRTHPEKRKCVTCLTDDDLTHIRYGLLSRYLQSLGYIDEGGDSAFNDHSTDDGGLSTWHQFHNPKTGNTLTVTIILEELLETEPAPGSA